MESKYDVLPFLPETRLKQFAPGLTILQPLSRRGHGPGILVLVSDSGVTGPKTLAIRDGVPSPIMKWAEEGYTVVEITEAALARPGDAIGWALEELEQCKTVQPKGVVGLVAYSPALWNKAASSLASFPQIKGASIYGNLDDNASTLVSSTVPQVHHLAGKSSVLLKRTEELIVYDYPTASSFLFATPFQNDFKYSLESVSHTRNLTFLKKLMNGPYFDLEAIWDEHTYYEFENRSVECTMCTMVQEPYVNHIPTLTGGIGREKLTAFYRDHFIFTNPADTETELISRSVGIDRVVDEFIFKCTHNATLDWLLPGVPATGRKLEIPFMAVVNIRGDRLYHEHIAWDQATALDQLGLLPKYLPFHNNDASTKQLEYRLPVSGFDATAKLRNKESVESNQMFSFSTREV